MIILKFKKKYLSVYQVFFAKKPNFYNWLTTYYIQALSKDDFIGFKRTPKYTKIIDLTVGDFEKNFDKNTSYEIRRAIKDEVVCQVSNNLLEFILMYNNFVVDKGLTTKISEDEMLCYSESLILTNGRKLTGENLVYHSYIVDESLKRVRLLHSTSKIYSQNELASEKAFVGRANRLLHLSDMNYFRDKGYEIYDFGGYAFETSDSSLKGINAFKDSFGGELKEESVYEAIPKYFLRKIITIFKRHN